MSISMLFVSALLLAALALLGAVFHKVRRVHYQTYELLEHMKATRAETEALFAQLQCAALLDRLLHLPNGLPPTRGWAGSPDFLLHLARHVLATKPAVLAECSSGVSTLVLARCAQINGRGHVYSLEHEAEYAQKTRDMLAENGLAEWATVLHAPLRQHDQGYHWYDTSDLPSALANIEVLVVDGPPQAIGPLARYPALPQLQKRLAERFVVFADDSARPDEQEMVRRWMKEFPGTRVKSLPAEKGLAMVSRG